MMTQLSVPKIFRRPQAEPIYDAQFLLWLENPKVERTPLLRGSYFVLFFYFGHFIIVLLVRRENKQGWNHCIEAYLLTRCGSNTCSS